MLVRLMYASHAGDGVGNEDLQAIVSQCKTHNPQAGLTGVLCFAEGVFLQVLEGGRREVNELYARIVADRRHTRIELLSYEEIGQRRFGHWSMGQVNAGKVNRALLLRYGPRAVLDPFAMPAASSLALLTELAESASVVCGG